MQTNNYNFVKTHTSIFCLLSSDTVQVLMFVSPTVPDLLYGYCHPCFHICYTHGNCTFIANFLLRFYYPNLLWWYLTTVSNNFRIKYSFNNVKSFNKLTQFTGGCETIRGWKKSKELRHFCGSHCAPNNLFDCPLFIYYNQISIMSLSKY